ncbi:MAG: hypothetical protein COA93_11025 [Alphaproteobacteria bacterium]|nr:MAG: hypothetical protein COA93_11025 [Alphaproteobacteria bacterium]
MEINPVEAEIVRRIFKLYIHGEGDKGPMGMKAIANLLNTESIPTRKGGKFLMQYIHKILSNEAYVTRHVFNRRNSKTRKLKPEDQWIYSKSRALLKMSILTRFMTVWTAIIRSPHRPAL